MNFKEIIIGKSIEGLDISSFRSETVISEKWLYLIAGVYGDDIESIYCLEQIQIFLRKHLASDLPIIVIPILNRSGYVALTRLNSQGKDINQDFPHFGPISSLPKTENKDSDKLQSPEAKAIQKVFLQYPPQLCITFYSHQLPKIEAIEEEREICAFFAKYNQYPIELKKNYKSFTIESYAMDFFAAPSVSLRLPKISPTTTLKDVWKTNEKAFKNFFEGQIL